MLTKKFLLSAASATILFLSSCKKDVTAPENEMVNADAVSSNLTANEVPETASPVVKTYVTYVNNNCAGYLEVLPARYPLTTKTYPLIIFLHGIGELGTGTPTKLACCGLPYYANNKRMPAEFIVGGQHFSFIVVAPQFKSRATAADVQSVIAYATKKYRVDPTRIYVSGLSLGGGSTWDFSTVYGQNVAAVTPVCGGTTPTVNLAKAIASKNLPVWTIHSNTDQVVPVSYAINWINWLKAANPAFATNYKATILYGGEDHNASWAKAYNPVNRWDGYNVYEWMLRYKRSGGVVTSPTPAPTPTTGNQLPYATAGLDQTVKYYSGLWVSLVALGSKDPDGSVVSYSWQSIGGPTTYKIASPTSAKTAVSLYARGTYVFRVTVTDNRGAKTSDYCFVTVN